MATITEKRGNLYSYHPSELRIIGGLALPEAERGEHDTIVEPTDPLYDERIGLVLEESFIANIDALGVTTPIKVAKLDGFVTVIVGRQRVRAARIVNQRRSARGEPPLMISATLEPSRDGTRLMSIMIAENEGRYADTYATKMAKARRYLERGVATDDAAVIFNMKPAQLRAWLRFDADASDVVRQAVESGKISISAGMELVRAGDADAQATALHALSSADDEALDAMADAASAKPRKITATAAREAAKRVTKGADANTGISDRRTMRKLLQACFDKDHPKNTSERTIAFWSGVENALMLILGDQDADKRLVEMLNAIRSGK